MMMIIILNCVHCFSFRQQVQVQQKFFVSSSSLSGDSDLNQGYDYEEASNVKAINQCSIIEDNKTSISYLIEPISGKIIA
jgi:hypothetical protein